MHPIRMLRRLPLLAWLIALMLLVTAAAAACTALLAAWLPLAWAAALAAGLCATVGVLALWRLMAPLRALVRTLAGTVASYRDGDFSTGVVWSGYRDVADLVQTHNDLGDTLRTQRLALVQRELMLDTIVQNTPVAMLLLDPGRHVVLGNLAARRLFGDGRRLEGQRFDTLIATLHPAMRDALQGEGDGLFSIGDEDAEDIHHITRRVFRLNGRPHALILLRQMTAELRRQEVQTWKKVIRVISHELNNSLAPIASLAHSGRELLRRGRTERLPEALDTIEQRARHLEGFIRDYARFAKLPAPRLVQVAWREVLDRLRSQIHFHSDGPRDGHVRLDVAQFEQAMLNLLRNALESGSDPAAVSVQLRALPDAWRVTVLDRGSGMNPAVLENALLPFYSTKRNGTGLGLALAREIAEAHGGRIALHNREGGGLGVSLTLPR